MTIKGIQGFNHLPEISDYPRVGNFITDFMINEQQLNIAFYKSQLQYTGISVNKVDEKNFCSFRRVGHMNQPHAFNNFFEIDTDKLDPELLTGVWHIGVRMATGPASAVAAGSIPLSPNLMVITYFDSNGREDYSSVPYSSNMNAYIQVEVDFTNYPTSTVVNVLQDGVQIDQFTGTRERVILRFGNIGTVDVSGVRTAFLENDNPDSWWGFTDYYFDHDTDGAGNPGALTVSPVNINVSYGADTWTSSDGVTSVSDILTSELLADGSNAEEPYVISNPKGRSLQFTLGAAGIIEDIKHVEVSAVSSIPSVGESTFNVQTKYKGSVSERRSIIPARAWGIANLMSSGNATVPSLIAPDDLQSIFVNINSHIGEDPIPYPFDTGIGPTDLIAGNHLVGLFGEFTIEGQTYGDLSASVGANFGSAFVSPSSPLSVIKCIYNGKVLLIPKYSVRQACSWNDVYSAGLVYGDNQTDHPGAPNSTIQNKTIAYHGYVYKVRLPTTWENDDVFDQDLPILHPDFEGNSLSTFPPGTGGEVASLFSRLVGTKSQGGWETKIDINSALSMELHPLAPGATPEKNRYFYRWSSSGNYIQSRTNYPNVKYRWHPVLELVQE